MPKLSKAEWEKIRIEYEAGELSIKVIADKYNISRTAVSKKGKSESWDGSKREHFTPVPVTEKELTDKWKLIKAEYEAGDVSLETIGEMYNISRSCIMRKARQLNWDRHKRAHLDSVKDIVTAEISSVKDDSELQQKGSFFQKIAHGNRKEAVSAFAERAAAVVVSHYYLLKRARVTSERILMELERRYTPVNGSNKLPVPDGTAERSMAEDITVFKILIDSMEKLISLERGVFNFNQEPGHNLLNHNDGLDENPQFKGMKESNESPAAAVLDILIEAGAILPETQVLITTEADEVYYSQTDG